jgi:hypothetical protein
MLHYFLLRKKSPRFPLRTAEGMVLPHNTRAELCRYLARLGVVRQQIRAIEQGRPRQLAMAPPEQEGPHAMMRLIARVLGVGIETADMLVNEFLSQSPIFGKLTETCLHIFSDTLADASADQRKRRINRGAPPVYLPRVHVTIAPDSTACPRCRGTMQLGTYRSIDRRT